MPFSQTESSNRIKFWTVAMPCLIAATLVMGAGWGIRGSFGHCRGAMMPGAMLGLVLAACSGRPDWWRRSPMIGLLSGVGWAIGGSSSYGILVGYTMKEELSTSIYGYFSLMIVGALYGSIGCGLLALALTKSRSFLENALWPMAIVYVSWLLLDWTGAMHWSLDLVKKNPETPDHTHWLFDTVWLYALATPAICSLLILVRPWRGPAVLMLTMSVGWWLAMALLIGAIGFRINPSRNDSWAGVLGILLGLVAYLVWTRNRAALMLLLYGLVGGGVGFPVGQFLQAMGRFKFGIMGSVPFFAELDHWTLMEQTLGYCMGLAAALGVWRLVRLRMIPPEEDCSPGWLNWVSAWVLLGVLLVFNSGTNFSRWQELELLKPTVMNLATSTVVYGMAIIWLVVLAWAIVAQKKKCVDLLPSSSKGKAQLFALTMMIAVMSLYVMLPSLRLPTSLMLVTALSLGGLCVIHAGVYPSSPTPSEARDGEETDGPRWIIKWVWIVSTLAVILLQVLLGFATHHLPRP